MPDLERIANDLSQLTVLEAAELSRMLEDKWGVSASQPVIQQAPVVVETVPVEQQVEFDVILAGVDANKKINVIKRYVPSPDWVSRRPRNSLNRLGRIGGQGGCQQGRG